MICVFHFSSPVCGVGMSVFFHILFSVQQLFVNIWKKNYNEASTALQFHVLLFAYIPAHLGPHCTHKKAIKKEQRQQVRLNWRIRQHITTKTCSTCHLFLADLLLDPDDGGSTFLRNVGELPNHNSSHLKRLYSLCDTV
jgi:hypothetical protein